MSQNSRKYNTKFNLQFMYNVSNGHRESWLKDASQLLNQFPPGFVYVNIITERIPSGYWVIPGYRLASNFLTSPNASKFSIVGLKMPLGQPCLQQLYLLFEQLHGLFLLFSCLHVWRNQGKLWRYLEFQERKETLRIFWRILSHRMYSYDIYIL